MFDTDRRFKIHWELTDLCNLKCPMCPRTDTFDRCRPVKEIQNTQFFLEDVKAYLPDSFLKRLNRIDFCGNFGDPCIARDFYEICEFLVLNYKIPIEVSTNGSMRHSAWWKKLGALFADTDSRIEFHVDGLRDTHHLYRIGANWDKIMANAEAFISGGAKADWYYILFKHNQHQVDETYEIARKMGFTYFVLVETGRFSNDGTYRYMHPDGKWRDLKQATISTRDGMENTPAAAIRQKHARLPGPETSEKVAAANVPFQKNNPNLFTTVNGITCKSAVKNRFFLDSQGYIAPCCWVSNRDVQRPGDMRRSVSLAGRNLESFNIRNRPIEEILHDELFTQVFSDLWGSDSLVTCRKKCGKKHRNYTFKIKL
jgi:MoaA/NifB/PqqE/SkfB family radical SAM enzyme